MFVIVGFVLEAMARDAAVSFRECTCCSYGECSFEDSGIQRVIHLIWIIASTCSEDCSSSLASSGVISGFGFASAKMIGLFIRFTSSIVTFARLILSVRLRS